MKSLATSRKRIHSNPFSISALPPAASPFFIFAIPRPYSGSAQSDCEQQRRIVVCDRVVVLRAVAIIDCAPVKSDAEFGIETQRMGIICDGAIGIALNGISKALGEMGAAFRIEPDRFRVIEDRALVVAFTPVRVSSIEERQVVRGA